MPATSSPKTGRGSRAKVRPVFLVTPARCGSTLLRYLLDSHPDVVSPPELNLSALLQHTAAVWSNVEAAQGVVTGDGGADVALSPIVRRKARKVVDDVMASFATPAGASVFCDKSLTTVDHLSVVSQCYPTAHFIFLYRYPLDMIASGIEASRWGFNAYGFAPFVGAAPGNFVGGLANYWIDRVSKMVEFERTCAVPHARLYYELLCDDPVGTLAELCAFLEIDVDDGLVERVFSREHGRGPGDYKIDFTGHIVADSVGRGSSLPRHLAPAQVAQLDQLCAALDYPPLESAQRGELAALLGLRRSAEASASAELDERVRLVRQLLEEHRGPAVRSGDATFPPMAIVLRGDGAGEIVLRVDAGARVTQDDGPIGGPAEPPVAHVWCVGDVLLDIAAGNVNMAQAAHDGHIRIEPPEGESTGNPTVVRQLMKALGSLLRPPADD